MSDSVCDNVTEHLRIGLFFTFCQDLNGRLLTVNKAAPRGSRPERQPRVYEPAFRVYVGNLP